MPARRGDLGDPGRTGRLSSSISIATPLAAARWPASAPSPSLTSIIAVAPAAASARPAASRGAGSTWRARSAPATVRSRRPAQLGPAEHEQPGGGAAELAGDGDEIAGARPGAADERVRASAASPTTVTATISAGARR